MKAACLYTLESAQSCVKSLEFSCDGTWLASSGSSIQDVLLWNVEQRSIARVFGPDLDYHGDFVERFHFTADGTKLNVYFTYTEDDLYRSWNEWTSYSLENLGEKEGPFSVDEAIAYNRDRSQDKWEGYQLLLRDRDATGLQWLTVTENGATIRYRYDKDAAVHVWAKKLLLIPTGIDVKEIRVASYKNRLAMACGADGLVIVDIAEVEEEYHPVSKLRADMKYDWILGRELTSYE